MSAEGLTRKQQAELVCGAGFWRSAEVPGSGIRSFVLSDGPHGVRLQPDGGDALGLGEAVAATCYPPAAGIASSWNVKLIERVGVALGEEARAQGVGVLLGPGINIKRSPLCGRNFEYFSEDPLLSGRLGAAWVRGLQSQGVGASLKHFAANNQETNRMTVSAEVDERTLRELYLPAFEHVVTTEQPWTVMAAYNRVNGVYATESRWLLTSVLREEWGFEGLVVSDWGAVDDRVAALDAGMDLEMPGPQASNAAALVESGVDLSVSAQRVARLAARVASGAASGAGGADPGDAAHHEVARDAARESIVLLRNEGGVLPLKPGASIAVLGEFAREPRFQGAGSSQVTATRVDAALDFLPGAVFTSSVNDAAAADVALVFAGLPSSAESEGFDRADLDLPPEQVALILAVAAVQPNTVVVLTNGGVVSLEPWHDAVAGIVEGWLLGQAGGSALADVLTGVVSPSGRLAETIPLRLADTPAFVNFPGDGDVVRYGEGVFVGYRHYESVGREVRYPFGYGLTYSRFAYSAFAVSSGPTGSVASVTVTNAGGVAAADVVQVYLSGPGIRPRRVLAAFEKVFLAPGQSQTVTLALPTRAFEYWDEPRSSWQTAGGAFGVELGRSAHDIVAAASVVMPSSIPVAPLSLDSTVAQWLAHPVTGPLFRRASAGAVEGGADVLAMVASMPIRRLARFPGVPVSLGQLRLLARVANNRVVRAVAGLFARH
ncbi:glycoside hydrolase family 3 C-terminal domain-containing protein [soil metagenome]